MSSCHLGDVEDLRRQATVARTEMNNIRHSVLSLRRKHEKDIEEVRKMLEGKLTLGVAGASGDETDKTRNPESDVPAVRPIAYMESVFRNKNGTPRQSGVCSKARGKFTILNSVFTNPEHSLQGLSEFSHVWLVFLFHENGSTACPAKVRPPRLGAKTGVFSTRSPHRPNPIGLTLAKLESVRGSTVEVSGIDIINGTPILDIKPYIPQYDQPIRDQHSSSQPIREQQSTSQPIGDQKTSDETFTSDAPSSSGKIERSETAAGANSMTESIGTDPKTEIETENLQIADWISKPKLKQVYFTSRALQGLEKITPKLLENRSGMKKAIESILLEDPRSVYRREKCADRLYYFSVDNAHITAWFDGDCVEVLGVQSVDPETV